MKILQVIPYFAPSWSFGGPVKVCYQISKELINEGNQVTVWTTDAADQNKPITRLCEVLDNISVKRFRNLLPSLTHGYNVFTPLGFYGYAKKEIVNYDLVHCHSFFTYQNIVIRRLCKTKKIPYIIHLHEMPVPHPLLGKRIIKVMFNFFFGKNILRDAAKIIVVSTREKDILSQYLPDISKKIEVVPNPIEHYETKSKNIIKEKNEKVILYLGRLSFIKAIDKLIKAFGELLKRDDSYRLVIAGPDENGNLVKLVGLAAELKISDKIEFTGMVSDRQKEEIFGRSDIFALFSDYESFSVATLEALQHGLPCCLSKNIGIADQVKNAGCGIIMEDTESSAKCALSLELTYKMRYKLSENCSGILSLFELPVITKSIINIYKGII